MNVHPFKVKNNWFVSQWYSLYNYCDTRLQPGQVPKFISFLSRNKIFSSRVFMWPYDIHSEIYTYVFPKFLYPINNIIFNFSIGLTIVVAFERWVVWEGRVKKWMERNFPFNGIQWTFLYISGLLRPFTSWSRGLKNEWIWFIEWEIPLISLSPS